MKKSFIALLISAIACAAGQTSAFAWGQNGHRITAEIAERNLDKKALAVVRSIIGEESLAELATWPDDIRSEKEWDFVQPWHFVSIEDDQSFEEILKMEAEDEAVNSILEIFAILEDFLRDPAKDSMELEGKFPQKHKITKRDALAFYIHFIGDVHQPLHVGRKGDQGGNKIQVSWFGEELSLHKVWDESLIESAQLSYTEFATFLNRVSDAERKEWADSSYIDWAKESMAARPQVYDFDSGGYFLNKIPSLSYDYRHEALPIVRDRLKRGGIRLAAKLNEIFAGYPE